MGRSWFLGAEAVGEWRSDPSRTNHACRYSILHTTFSSYPAQPSSINMPCALENSEAYAQAFVEAGETEPNNNKKKTEMKPGEQLVHHSGRQQRLLISQEPIRLTTAMSHPNGTEHCSKTILFEERGGHSPSVGSVLVLGAFCARAAATRRSSSSRGEAWRQELDAGLISQLASTYSTPG
jgi:hypothetical protein